MRRALPVVLALGAGLACELAPLEVEGLRCDDASSCGVGYFCVQGQCTTSAPVDASIPFDQNLLSNPSFEFLRADGGVADWKALAGRLSSSTSSRTGLRGGRVEAATQQSPTLGPQVTVGRTELGMLFCASLWVRTDLEADAGLDLVLTIREHFDDAGVVSSSGTRINGVRGSWVQVQEKFAAFGNGAIEPRLTTVLKLDAGAGYFVDDAVLVRPDGGSCP